LLVTLSRNTNASVLALARYRVHGRVGKKSGYLENSRSWGIHVAAGKDTPNSSKGAYEPELLHEESFRPNGTPLDEEETALICSLSEK
jgi:hypothetical protein